jgi:hypothetical protein
MITDFLGCCSFLFFIVVLLKDVSDFLHIKTADIIKDKSIKSVLIEDAKDMIQTSSECSFYQERIQSRHIFSTSGAGTAYPSGAPEFTPGF